MSFGGAVVLRQGEGKRLEVLGIPFVYKARESDTRGGYSLSEIVQSGEGPPPHTHKNEEEALYVLEGDLRVTIGNDTVTGGPGTFFLIPRGTVHTQAQAGSSPVRLLIIFSPAAFEKFFEEVAGETDMDKITAVAARHGMEFVG